ncbi:DUF4190 domain-containing protein [Streptomyces spinoverrucosus]|uniref:DUF4190 domain-containing protein n=1 Tax=Streptomyces spinoverrucosus TaxID=284043 RepID=UPI0018C3C8CA|nr:DUF4190 domain-containing protein [Streptomyces spinoverrucosus]MBG0852738.1 DUF4190 domain-containing protein [Streptomyces spinoverrucosus]
MSIPPPPGPQQPQDPQGPYGPYSAPQAPGSYGAQGPYGSQGPYGPQPPYGAWGPYPPPGLPPVNGVAIAALVLGILCFLPAIGLVLGLIALRQIKRKGERGKGMAVTGAVLSTVGLALLTVSLSTGAVSDFWEGFKEGARESAIVSPDKGECFDSPNESLEGETYDVDVVPCSGRHDGEVFATVTLPGGTFPGDDHVTKVADDKCYALQGDYAMDNWALPDNVDVYYLAPTRESWSLGDREITCVFGNADERGSLTGSLRNDASTLDADQVAYLKAVRAIDAVLEEEPEAFPDEDLAANKAWAQDVHDVLAEQGAALDAHTWPADAERPMADLVTELESARKEWAKAADAEDADTFYVHYDEAYGFYDGPTTVTAREALGLDTSPPADDAGEGGSDTEV